MSDQDSRIPRKLEEALKALNDPPEPVSPELDDRIKKMARRELSRPTGRIIKWPWAIGAVAAALLLAIGLSPFFGEQPRKGADLADTGDIDRNGTVDIVDAYLLARAASEKTTNHQALDMNADGQIDLEDARVIARTAVRMNRGPQ